MVSPFLDTGDYVSVAGSQLRLRRAGPRDRDEIYDLLGEATAWLRGKDTDQWEKPWPSREARDRRILTGLENGGTWIVRDALGPVATITVATRPDPGVWSDLEPGCDLADRAVYVHRLITSRKYAGLELGSELIDWAGYYGERLYGAQWIRVDVWTSNLALHAYYTKRGFLSCGSCADPCYPSRALFQKPLPATTRPRFARIAWEHAVAVPAPAARWHDPHRQRSVLSTDGENTVRYGESRMVRALWPSTGLVSPRAVRPLHGLVMAAAPTPPRDKPGDAACIPLDHLRPGQPAPG
jgi:hypothetical protein